MVTTSRLGKAFDGRSRGKHALANKSFRRCGRLAMMGIYSARKGDLISSMNGIFA